VVGYEGEVKGNEVVAFGEGQEGRNALTVSGDDNFGRTSFINRLREMKGAYENDFGGAWKTSK
jgi:hypothetical protein